MTEDEAKTKPCPTMRYCVNENGVIQESESAIYVHANCMGSACIAWRWLDIPLAERRYQKPQFTLSDPLGQREGAPLVWVTVPAKPGDGYCGLAGKP